MLSLKDLGQPLEFWEYFEKISKIPRCSQYEERIRNYIQSEGERFGFKTQVDKAGNLAIFIPASVSQEERIILQCHLDMVCEKNEGIVHDFLNDPLKLKIIEIDNEKWIVADGTSLGADNGTGICYLLSLMKKIHDKSLKFDSLSFTLIFTILEEYNMGGVKNMEKDLVNGNYLINLDSGIDGMITIGCTGGIGFTAEIETNPSSVNQINGKFIPLKLKVTGLVGGHSGGNINLGRANAIKVLIEILWKLNHQFSIFISSIDGGSAANAIPRESNAILYVREDQLAKIKEFFKVISSETKILFEGIEKNMKLSIESIASPKEHNIISEKVQGKLLNFLNVVPSGPLSLYPGIKILAYTSTNLGILKTEKEYIKMRMLHRSFSGYHNKTTCEKIKTLLEMSGLKANIKITGSYPPWTPNFKLKFLDLAKEAHYEVYNKEAKIIAIHGGLESTVIINLNPQIEAIAIGPTTRDVHSPNERLLIKSVERTWNFLLAILKKLEIKNSLKNSTKSRWKALL
ncbi:MAG: Cytosol non-specific dipeptidase [Candidatus Lokiarchaeum sp. GC14_75]|nr:MAG: Cytosol non-specific dipeptidase [Candidatus Lokiarchaeum sp. GC14_75]